MKVVIVGGVAGGASCAARLRRLDEYCDIVMLEKGEHVSFANCGLPYYVGGVIKDRSRLLVQTPDSLKQMLNIDARTYSEVVAINRVHKLVTVLDLVNNTTYEESYDKLVLAQGAKPFVPNIPGVQNERIFTLRTVSDADKIKNHVQNSGAKTVSVIGGGFTGVEMAENLCNLGLEVTLIEAADQVLAPLDKEMAEMVHKHMRLNGVELVFSDPVQSFADEQSQLVTTLSSGKTVQSDFIVFAIGVRPESELAKDAGLQIGSTGGVLVDRNLKTSDDDVFAVGDMIEVKDIVCDSKALIPLAGIANKQGRIVADNLAGMNSKFIGAQGTSVIKVFDLCVATTGSNEKNLKKHSIDYKKAYVQDFAHASYYPNAFDMTIKLMFSPEGRILGAQIVGIDGVDKRVDVLAAMLRHNKTVYDLSELELAYAPPYGSAKDPVNLIGMVCENILENRIKVVYPEELSMIEDLILVDVRTEQEFSIGHIEGAINIPFETLRQRVSELPRTRNIVLYCSKGKTSYFAYRVLTQCGFENVYNLNGGYSLIRKIKPDKNASAARFKQAAEPIKPKEKEVSAVLKVDACGLQCPGPIMKLAGAMGELGDGEVIEISATDTAFASDVQAWCGSTGNELLDVKTENMVTTALILKGKKLDAAQMQSACQVGGSAVPGKSTLVVFSNDLDRAIASFIIANGAKAAGKDVTMFFTFWGINILRKSSHAPVKKDLLSTMFGLMMPKGAQKLALSKMHMGGIGTFLMKHIMKKKQILTLQELMEQARVSGIKMIVCQMSMDVMGIQPEELLDGVEFAGVAKYIHESENASPTLFV